MKRSEGKSKDAGELTMRRKDRFAPIVVLILLGALPILGNTITVTNTADSGPGSLRNAIANATPGDTINFSLTYPATITLGSTLIIMNDLTIMGPGALNLAIDGNKSVAVFEVDSGTVTISGVTVQNGRTIYLGGGIVNNAALNLSNSTVSGNSSPQAGGGIENTGTMTVDGSAISGNFGQNVGGGIDNRGTMAITNSVISGNSTDLRVGIFGGGINNVGTMTINRSTVSGNSAVGAGGINNHGNLTITNTTVSGNSAGGNGTGGIININGTMTVTNSTIAGNSSTGISCFNPFSCGVTIKNTILANNHGNCFLFGIPGHPQATSQGHNLSDDYSCVGNEAIVFNQAGDLNGTPAGLDPNGLQNNGGPTQTIALLPTSPAKNAIPVSPTNYCTAIDGVTPIATDQRGIARPQGSGCDIGAFELVLPVLLPTSLTYNGAVGSDFEDPAILAATLTDQSANPIMGEPLTFTLGTQSCTAATNGTGQGSCALIPTQAAGTYNVVVTFAGDATYAQSSTTAPFSLVPEEDSIQYTGSRTFYEGGTATLSATLVEDGSLSLPIGGRPVTLTIGSGSGSQSCSATTNSAGQAQCTINPVSQLLGLSSVSASFPGDNFYNSATVSASALVIGNPGTAASSSIAANFNGTAIPDGSTVWFSSVLKPTGLGTTPVQIIMQNANIQFSTPSASYNLPVPNALITFSPTVTTASASFDSGLQLWMIQAPSSGLSGNTMLNALAFQTPSGGLPGGIKSVNWQGSFVTDTPGTSLQWQWAAAVYGQFSPDYNALDVKPVDDNQASAYKNSDHAGTPENFKTFVKGGATGGGGANYTGGYSGTAKVTLPVQ